MKDVFSNSPGQRRLSARGSLHVRPVFCRDDTPFFFKKKKRKLFSFCTPFFIEDKSRHTFLALPQEERERELDFWQGWTIGKTKKMKRWLFFQSVYADRTITKRSRKSQTESMITSRLTRCLIGVSSFLLVQVRCLCDERVSTIFDSDLNDETTGCARSSHTSSSPGLWFFMICLWFSR